MSQPTLCARPSRSVRDLVKARLHGFEIRQAVRQAKREAKHPPRPGPSDAELDRRALQQPLRWEGGPE